MHEKKKCLFVRRCADDERCMSGLQIVVHNNEHTTADTDIYPYNACRERERPGVLINDPTFPHRRIDGACMQKRKIESTNHVAPDVGATVLLRDTYL